MLELNSDHPLAADVVTAIRGGDVEHLETLLRRNTGLAAAAIVEDCPGGPVARSLLHIATDWPGHFPNGPTVVRTLIDHGAGVNARVRGPHSETPLHWAASSDDVPVLDALLDAGADIEAPGAVIGGGTPLADAVAFAQWNAARRLIERGARSNLWQSAALGLMDRIAQCFHQDPSPADINGAFWCACHGGRIDAAQYLLARGADLNWIGWDNLTPLDAATRSGAHLLASWLRNAGARLRAES